MKTKIIIALIIVVVSTLNIFLLSSCNSSTEPKESHKLVVENGFYSKVETSDSNEIKYVIEFVYYVRGEECNWGGYSIQMDTQAWTLDLYKMQMLKPYEKHTKIDTFKVNNELKTNPVVKMQGYRIGSSESYNELYAEYILQPK